MVHMFYPCSTLSVFIALETAKVQRQNWGAIGAIGENENPSKCYVLMGYATKPIGAIGAAIGEIYTLNKN